MRAPTSPATPDQLREAVLAGDLRSAYKLMGSWTKNGAAAFEIVNELLTPVAVSVGERWERADITHADEYSATSVLESLASALYRSVPCRGPRVLVVCAEGEEHALVGRLTAAYLAARGIRARFCGPHLPARSLSPLVERFEPDVVVVSTTTVVGLAGSLTLCATAAELGVPVIAGGAAAGNGEALRTAGAHTVEGGLDEVTVLVNSLAKRPRVNRPSIEIVDHSALVLAAMAAHAEAKVEPRVNDRELPIPTATALLRAASSAVLAEDESVFVTFYRHARAVAETFGVVNEFDSRYDAVVNAAAPNPALQAVLAAR